MYPVSAEYREAVYAPIRTAKAKVTFDISDVTAAGDVHSISTVQEFVLSNKEHLINKKRQQNYNLATWEPNRFKLDGSFSFADDIIENNKELGFCSSDLCDDTGVFSINPSIMFQFNDTHSSMGITVTFDVLNDEYATDFTINAYDEYNNLIISEDVVNNSLAQIAVLGQFYLYKKIELIIMKWSKPHRRCRVVEVDFGVVRVYTDENLIKLDLIEEMDIATSNLPAAEVKFTVDNSNREFNILNPVGFYKFLQERQLVVPEIGIVTGAAIEYIQLGNYYLKEWTSEEGSLTASFTARNIIDIMSSYDYENQVAKVDYSLYDMAVEVFSICGVKNYEIDEALKDIMTKGLVNKTDCRNVLQMLAIAGSCNIFVNREDLVILKQSPLIIGDVIDTIALDNMYKEPKIELDKIIKSVSVSYYTDLDTQLIYTEYNPAAKEGESIKIETNTLINDITQATNVAQWILRQLNYRAKYKVNWRGNPALEINDVVVIADSYNQNNKAIITKHELEYQGYLSENIEARGTVL